MRILENSSAVIQLLGVTAALKGSQMTIPILHGCQLLDYNIQTCIANNIYDSLCSKT